MEPPSPFRVTFSNQSGRKPLPSRRLVRAVQVTLGQHLTKSQDVHLLLTTDKQIQELNRQFRSLNSTTDVLTFPAPEFPGAPLGEIVISVETAARQANLRNVSLTSELILLAIHGALHLVGFDDVEDADRQEMQTEMARIAGLLGVRATDDWQSIYTEAKQ